MIMHYFATDGNYGDSAGMVLLDTSDWTDEQWDEIEEASDYDRVNVAIKLSNGMVKSNG